MQLGLIFALTLSLSGYGALTLLRKLGGHLSVGALPWWPLALVAAVAIFARALRRVAHPLSNLVDAADRIAEGELDARVQTRGPPWLRSVATAFNTMAGRLERQRQQRRELMADVAHELRTPLTVIQGRLESILDGVYPRDDAQLERLLDETRLLTRLVEDLRTLAHSEGGSLRLQFEPSDLRALLEASAEAFEPDARARGVTLTCSLRGSLDPVPLVPLDPIRIREVIGNLLANAIRHAPEHVGQVSLGLEFQSSGTAQITVHDNGPGIDSKLLPRIFDRFVKGDRSSGSGLGLTIARNLVVAHGGELSVRSGASEGTTLTVMLRPSEA